MGETATDPERWQRIQEVFAEVLGCPAEQRRTVLGRSCGEDPDLRREVESLLAADEAAGSFIRKPLVSAGAGPAGIAALATDLAQSPRRVGPYKLLRPIGQGGMSRVYLALRDDDEYQRRVAIKIVRQGLAGEDRLRRFHTERQILASLDHPYVARLYEGGTTEEGAPYFVMEYVEGLPIDEYCDQHGLSVAERVELFRKVCAAVHYAHQNLVVHRDLKPSNILVAAGGVPKLLDFGIAKLLNPELASPSPEPTVTWIRLMTPHYASPEQVRGKIITTASDVYSLGVLLCKLLTGHLPYRFTGRSPEEIERQLAEVEPARPSTLVGRRRDKLRRRLAGDLDNIVLMALRTEPQRRYGSAEQFSEDLRRHLAGLPVLAGKPSPGYRMGKFLRRNRMSVAMAALFAALVLGFGVAMAVQSSRVARERDEARRERDKNEQVLAFVEDIFNVADPELGGNRPLDPREFLARGAERIDRLRDQPDAQATLMNSMGNVYRNLGLYEEARRLLEAALESRREILGEEHPDVATTSDGLGSVLRLQGHYDEAEALHRRALQIRQGSADGQQLAMTGSLDLLASVLKDKGVYDEAELLFRRALETREELLGEEHLKSAESMSNLGDLLWTRGDFDEAEALHRRALQLFEKNLGAEHPHVATSLNNLAMVLVSKGSYEEAERLHRQALEMRRRLLGEEHYFVFQSLTNLTMVLFSKGDYEAVQRVGLEALALGRKALGHEHPRLAHMLLGLGSTIARNADPEQGEQLMREAVAIRRKALPEGHWLTGFTVSSLGAYLSWAGRYEEAEPLVVEGLLIIEAQRGRGDPETQKALKSVVDLYRAWGRPGKLVEYEAMLTKTP